MEQFLVRYGFSKNVAKLEERQALSVTPPFEPSPPNSHAVILQTIQALLDSGKPFSAEIMVAGDMAKLDIKEANPCQKNP